MARRVSRSGGSISVMRPGQEAAAQPVLEGLDGLGWAVRGEDDLLGGPLEVVVGVEELLLEPLLALHELDVVDQQDVTVAVPALEGQRGRGAQRVDEVVHEGLGGHVENLATGVVLRHVVPDGVEEVGLAQARVTVDEQGVVGPARGLGHGLGRRVGQAVRGGGDEGLEGELRIELDRRRLTARPGPGRSARPAAGARRAGRTPRRCRSRRVGGGRFLDLEAAADRRTHLVGQGVLDHGEVPGLHPLPDQPVGDGQDEDPVGERDGLNPRQPQLPRALRHLVAQRSGAPCPEISSLIHRVAERPFSPLGVQPPCSERSSVRVIG